MTKSTKNTSKYDEEGLVRLDLDLDFITYRMLLILVQRSGYDLAEEEGQNKSKKNEGFRGVITQALKELYISAVENYQDKSSSELHQGRQQSYIYSIRAKAMRKRGFSDEEIATKLRRKIPTYLSENNIVRKSIRQESFDELFGKAEWSDFKFDKSQGVIRLELERQGIRSLFVPDKAVKKTSTNKPSPKQVKGVSLTAAENY